MMKAKALAAFCSLAAGVQSFCPASSAARGLDRTPRAVVALREPDSRSKSRELLLPDIRKALDEVSLFVARADASRMRKPAAPTADCIEAYCAAQQRKLDLLMAEAKALRECDPEEGCETRVKWTDINGNDYDD